MIRLTCLSVMQNFLYFSDSFIFKAIALISIHTEENLENLTFGHNCEVVDYQPRPGADINGDEEYERLL